jgi:hypothetical protein
LQTSLISSRACHIANSKDVIADFEGACIIGSQLLHYASETASKHAR